MGESRIPLIPTPIFNSFSTRYKRYQTVCARACLCVSVVCVCVWVCVCACCACAHISATATIKWFYRFYFLCLSHLFLFSSRSTCPEVFCKKAVLRNFAKFIATFVFLWILWISKNNSSYRTPPMAASVFRNNIVHVTLRITVVKCGKFTMLSIVD